MTVELSRDAARRALIRWLALDRPLGRGRAGIRKTLERLGCIQLDPLDRIGTNADLVVLARVDGVTRGEVWEALFPKHAFEHFAKERCILPASAFAHYRARGHEAEAPWWSHQERLRRVPAKVVRHVLDEVRAIGPATAKDLTDHGAVEALDWSGWKGTGKATTMALEILWTRCDVVVAGRTENGSKLYDVPERALGQLATEEPDEPFDRWAVRERVRSAGLLARGGAQIVWSRLNRVKKSGVVEELIERGEVVEVAIEGSSRRYLAMPELVSSRARAYDDRVRILGPLEPLLWDRDLVRHLFDFDYVWEVYKPAEQRRWGWYVCPLLWRDQLVGRIDAHVDGKTLVVSKLWIEREVDTDAVRAALDRQAAVCGVSRVRMPRKWPSRMPRG